jgi:hypothetical protein
MPAETLQLIVEFSNSMDHAAAQLRKLSARFPISKSRLKEDAEQVLETRGEVLSYLLDQHSQVEERGSDELRVKRMDREKRLREEDERRVAKTQALLAKGKRPKFPLDRMNEREAKAVAKKAKRLAKGPAA